MTPGVELDVLGDLCQHLQDRLHSHVEKAYAHWTHAIAILGVVAVQLPTTHAMQEIATTTLPAN